MLDILGNIQESLVQKCCINYLQKEIDATKQRGDHFTHNDRIGITASGDVQLHVVLVWLRTVFHVIHYWLVVIQTLVIAFAFFSKIWLGTFFNKQKKRPLCKWRWLPPEHQNAKNWSERLWSLRELLIVPYKYEIQERHGIVVLLVMMIWVVILPWSFFCR